MLSIVEGEEVGGVVFSTVAARRPELKRELGILRQALLLEEQAGGGGGGDDGSEELKVCVLHTPCPHEASILAGTYATMSELKEIVLGWVALFLRLGGKRRFLVWSGLGTERRRKNDPTQNAVCFAAGARL